MSLSQWFIAFRPHRFASLVLVGLWLIFGVQDSALSAPPHDYLVPLTQITVDATVEGIGPGDVVCLEAGTRDRLRLVNFQGTSEAPITIQNCDGQTIIDVTGVSPRPGYLIAVINSDHYRLTGSGDPDHLYGIVAKGAHQGVQIAGLSDDGVTENVEVDHIAVSNVGFAGFMVKTDPNCDPATWRENLIMTDVRIHDNYVYYTEDGEGFYIGFTFSGGYDITCDGTPTTVYGHEIHDLQVYNNRTENTGSEGIQISSSPGAMIYNNHIFQSGQRPFADYQSNGMQIGYYDVVVHGNRIEQAAANGLIMFGTGHVVYNNLIIHAGASGTFADDRAVGPGYIYVNNTIVEPGGDGVVFYMDEATTPNVFKNNIVVNSNGAFFRTLNDNVVVDESNNTFTANFNDMQFVDVWSGNYDLQQTSPAVDVGMDASVYGVNTDREGTGRPQGGTYDVGAYEWSASDVIVGEPARIYPADSAGLNAGPEWPPFSFEKMPGIEWYGFWVGTSDYAQQYLYQWYAAADICDAYTCTLPTDLWILDGNLELWTTYWSPQHQSYNDYWNRTTFDVNYGEIAASNRTDPGGAGSPDALTWDYDDSVLWYRLWVGTADYSTTLIFDWFDVRDFCSASTCTLNVNDITFPAGNYKWWIEAWGPGDYRTWTEDGKLAFSITPG